MQFEDYVRKPYVLKAVQITEDNLDELAPLIGTIVTKKTGQRYIQVNRQKVPVLTKVFCGYWLTMMGSSIRCYSPRTFRDDFVLNAPEIQVWVDWMNPAGDLDGATQPV